MLPSNAPLLRLSISTLSICALLGCGGDHDSAETATVSPPREAPAAIAAELDDLSQRSGGRAIILYSQRGDAPGWAHVVGHRNGVDGPTAKWDDAFEIGSATMMFTAAAILVLEEEGKLSLTDPLTNYFDQALLDDLTSGGGAKLEIRHLLNHTSGIGDYINVGSDRQVLAHYGFLDDRTYTPTDLLELARSYTLHAADYPDLSILAPAFTLASEGLDSYDELTHNSYSSTGYIMLGMIIEQASGLSYERFLHERIFTPLGMSHTGLGTEGAKSAWVGHVTGVTDEPVHMSPSFGWSATAIVSTAPDMARFLRGAIGGRLFRDPATSQAWRTEDFIPLFGVLPYGRGLMNFNPYLGHVGQTFGADFEGSYDVEKDHAVVVAIGDSQKIDELRISTLAQNSEK